MKTVHASPIAAVIQPIGKSVSSAARTIHRKIPATTVTISRYFPWSNASQPVIRPPPLTLYQDRKVTNNRSSAAIAAIHSPQRSRSRFTGVSLTPDPAENLRLARLSHPNGSASSRRGAPTATVGRQLEKLGARKRILRRVPLGCRAAPRGPFVLRAGP